MSRISRLEEPQREQGGAGGVQGHEKVLVNHLPGEEGEAALC